MNGLKGLSGSCAWRSGAAWRVEYQCGTVPDLLRLAELDAESRWVRVHSVTRPALVLGSTQRLETADQTRAAAAGVDIVRRRSGGGAVLVAPDRQAWVDFSVPAGDPLWDDDVARAALWVGEMWSAVIRGLTGTTPLVHRAGLHADRWGKLICFAGVGPGEVLISGKKVVGVSQRRNRHRARFQSAVRVLEPKLANGVGELRSMPTRGVGELKAKPARGVGELRSMPTRGVGELEPMPTRGVDELEPKPIPGLDELELLTLTSSERTEARTASAPRSSSFAIDAQTVVSALLTEIGACD